MMPDSEGSGGSKLLSYIQESEEELGESIGGCSICQLLRLPHPKGIETKYGELKNSAADGCKLCETLHEISQTAHDRTGGLIVDANAESVIVEPQLVEEEIRTAWLTVKPGEQGIFDMFSGRNRTSLYVLPGCKSPWPFIGPYELPADSPDIRDCAHFIRDALDTCDTEHIDCATYQSKHSSKSPASPSFIPKRLLNIGDKIQADRPRLYEPANDDVPPNATPLRYAASSHCWGKAPVASTTEDLLPGYIENGIEWSELSKTFQEAVLLVRELAIDYIWIDSLCIIQDSVSDWAQQSSHMADIFSNAYITIAASAAENSREGLLNREKNPQFLIAHDAETYTIFTHRFINHELRISQNVRWGLHVIDGNIPFPNLTEFTLRKRAWCFQEEVLSKRVVHFTRDEMVFICREGTICECQSDWLPRFLLPPFLGVREEWSMTKYVWMDIVTHFSKRQISFSKDKLPALSGLTPYFEQDSGRYLAGLWEFHMPECLLWAKNYDSLLKSSCSALSDPPSWSWASVDNEILFDVFKANEYTDFAELLDAEIYPSTNDARGMVSGGRLTLKAPLLPLERRDHREHAKKTWFADNELYSPGWIPHSTGDNKFSENLDDLAYMMSALDNSIPDMSASLLVIRGCTRKNNCEMEIQCLIVKQLEDLSKNQNCTMEGSMTEVAHVRIGCARVSSSRAEILDLLDKYQTTVTLL